MFPDADVVGTTEMASIASIRDDGRFMLTELENRSPQLAARARQVADIMQMVN